MKRTFLSRLQTNGIYYLAGALILLVVIPLYQVLVLFPQGYNDALTETRRNHTTTFLLWIGKHTLQFIGYRTLLILAFLCLLSLPFTLFRIIVAQEILGTEEEEPAGEENSEPDQEEPEAPLATAWRGKGYAVLAAWSGLFGLILFIAGTLTSTLYLSLTQSAAVACGSSCTTLPGVFNIITYTAGGGLLALASLLFGAVIARRGHNLWPGIWVFFGYTALALAALLSGSAVAVASTPTEGQALLTSPAILFLALWVLWFGIMLVRLKPEA